ncbi:T9SS type A sorting domain-containing protein [Maribellus sediminis]|uniref:pectate lyase family protein n=1 Tax=Maribellus sediminis TaxID=2696285 RepID=UPI00142F3F54|nr:T9SS type A sorting domain-containing protein [Maribellus sediminis]
MKHRIKIFLLFLTLCLANPAAWSQPVTIEDAGGWLESVWVKWHAVEGAESYNVYVSGEGITNQQIDGQLVRDYGAYFRADALGLAPGTYTLKIIPVIAGTAGESTETGSLIITAHDRTGFAFANEKVPGAYKANGTPKDNAVILYITQNTKNTISLDVTGANANPCVGLQTILEGFKKGKDNRPLIVRLIGQITDLEYMDKGDIVIENNNNQSGYITFEGVGNDAVADGWGIRVKNASNVEIRNIGLMNTNSDEGDDIGLQQENEYIWVHHCDLFYGDAGGDADQAKGDGAMDCKRSTYVTLSYNHFWDTGKSNLLGLNEDTTEGLFITYHHNWYDHSDSRHPRVRFYSAHVYNNYYDGIAKYGVGSTMGSSVFVEANYFRNCRYPMLTSMQGSDVFDENTQSNDYSDMPTFSKEDGGTIKAWNNCMSGQRRFVPYGDAAYPNSTVDFDAYVADSRDEKIDSSIKSAYGSNTYNNFDTNEAVMYTYTPDEPEAAKEKVMQYAGRMNGGDFQWTFNNSVDDASYSANSALKTALVDYQTSLIAVMGDTVTVEDTTGGGGGTGGSEISGDIVHNFTKSGLTSDYFSITGNLSDSKGTVVYGGLTLTQCLKIESTTLIEFTTTEEAVLTLVFNDNYSGRIKVDGTNYSATNGIITLTIPAGSHQITKTDVANLYLINLDLATGIRDNELSGLIVFPNPVNDQLTIKSSQIITSVGIYNLNGGLVKKSEGNIKNIDVGELKSGSYLLRILTKEGTITKKIVKK